MHLSSNPVSSACELIRQTMCRKSSGMNSCSLLPAVLRGQSALAWGQEEKGTSPFPLLPELICSGIKEENDWRLWSFLSAVQGLLHTFLYTEVDQSIHSIRLAFLGFTFINHSELREGHPHYFKVLRQRIKCPCMQQFTSATCPW